MWPARFAVTLLAALGAVIPACSPPGPEPASSPTPGAARRIARLRALTGGVQVKALGNLEWVKAVLEMDLGGGDRVRTDPASAAEIAFADGMVLKVGPESLLLIEATPSLYAGEFEFDAGRKAAGSAPALSTPTFRWTGSEEVKERPAGAVEVGKSGDGRVEQHRGRGRVATGKGETIELGANERLDVDAQGRAGGRVALPAPPILLSPPHESSAGYPDVRVATTVLVWRAVPGAASYHVVLDDDGWFVTPLVDRADVDGTSLEVPGLNPGTYYWRVSSADGRGTEGAFSTFARFSVRAAAAGPTLVLDSLEVRKNIVQVKGRTEPGVVVSVNGQRVDVREDGYFLEFITLPRLGVQEIVVRAEGPGGGVTTRVRSVSVTTF